MTPRPEAPGRPNLALIDSLLTETPDGGVALEVNTVKVCKVGPTSSFVATFKLTETLHDPFTGAAAGQTTKTVQVTAGTCMTVDTAQSEDPEVEIEEILPAGVVVDSIDLRAMRFTTDTVTDPFSSYTKFITHSTLTGTNSVTVAVGHTPYLLSPFTNRQGAVVTFYNGTTLPGTEGCTPGYWKQSQHFDSWVGYSPDQKFSSVFDDAFPGMTLLDVLQQGGGGLNALGRHTVAALLDAANSGVDYGLTTTQVIAKFNAVYPGGDYEGLKDEFAGRNERSCPLN